jgi:hypothetical protein
MRLTAGKNNFKGLTLLIIITNFLMLKPHINVIKVFWSMMLRQSKLERVSLVSFFKIQHWIQTLAYFV